MKVRISDWVVTVREVELPTVCPACEQPIRGAATGPTMVEDLAQPVPLELNFGFDVVQRLEHQHKDVPPVGYMCFCGELLVWGTGEANGVPEERPRAGRPRLPLPEGEMVRMKAAGATLREIAAATGVPVSTVHRFFQRQSDPRAGSGVASAAGETGASVIDLVPKGVKRGSLE